MDYKKILIVDDSRVSRMIIKQCFEAAGLLEADFAEASDGIEALSYLEENELDLIVTDLNMPKLDGNTMIKKLNAMRPDYPYNILIISSIADESLIEEMKDKSVKGIINKPISPQKVYKFLQGEYYVR